MMLVDKETGKGYVEMEKVHRDKKEYANIRAKKDSIIEEANKELELFKKFQIAAQANPKLTYVDFCNNIKNKEV